MYSALSLPRALDIEHINSTVLVRLYEAHNVGLTITMHADQWTAFQRAIAEAQADTMYTLRDLTDAETRDFLSLSHTHGKKLIHATTKKAEATP